MSDPLEQIKALYYRTSKATIVGDFDAAVDLLKAMSGEDERERATVYMQGLAEMKSEWALGAAKAKRASAAPQSATAPGRSGRSTRGGRRPR
jgi:hypothetical protein